MERMDICARKVPVEEESWKNGQGFVIRRPFLVAMMLKIGRTL
jgi:hypothetical protein